MGSLPEDHLFLSLVGRQDISFYCVYICVIYLFGSAGS